jgi:hypothetical protein
LYKSATIILLIAKTKMITIQQLEQEEAPRIPTVVVGVIPQQELSKTSGQ